MSKKIIKNEKRSTESALRRIYLYLFMILTTIVYGKGAVYLLTEHYSRKLMRKGHSSHGKTHICALLDRGRQTKRAAYDKIYCTLSRKGRRSEIGCQLLRAHKLTLYAHGYNMVALAAFGENLLSLALQNRGYLTCRG